MALEFTINLKGDFAGALQKSNKELGETEKHAKRATHELELFEGELGRASIGALSINFDALREGGHFFQFDLAEGAAIAFEAVHKVVEEVIDLGKEMIGAAANAEDLNLAVKLDVGEEGARQVDELAESFKGTRFDDNAIKEALLPILEESGNKNAALWDDMVTAATDVAARRKTGVAGTKAALESLNDIELNPQRLRGSLKSLGIKQLEYYKDLGALLGISEKEAERQTKEGKVKAQTLLSVALHQIAQREGGALGNATNDSSKTLGTSIERLANLKENLFEKLAGGKGMKALQSGVDTFVDTMQGPVGTDLINTIDEAFVSLFGDLSGPEGAKKLEAVVIDLTHDVKDMIEWFRGAWPDIKAGASTVWDVMKEIAHVTGMIWDGWKGIVELMKFNPAEKPALAGENRGHAAYEAERQRNLEKAHDDVGAIAGDLDIPKFAAGGIVGEPTLALIGENGPEAVVPLGSRFGQLPDTSAPAAAGGDFGAPSVTYAPVFQFSGAPREVREQIEAFEQQHRIALGLFIDELRAAHGA